MPSKRIQKAEMIFFAVEKDKAISGIHLKTKCRNVVFLCVGIRFGSRGRLGTCAEMVVDWRRIPCTEDRKGRDFAIDVEQSKGTLWACNQTAKRRGRGEFGFGFAPLEGTFWGGNGMFFFVKFCRTFSYWGGRVREEQTGLGYASARP